MEVWRERMEGMAKGKVREEKKQGKGMRDA